MAKQKSYFITDKLVVTASIKHGQSQVSVSRDNGVPDLTIHGWLRDKEMVHDFAALYFRMLGDETISQ